MEMDTNHIRRTYPFRRNRFAIAYLCLHVILVVSAYFFLSYLLSVLPHKPENARLLSIAQLMLNILAVVLCIKIPLYLCVLLILLLGKEKIEVTNDGVHTEQHFVFFRMRQTIPRSQVLAIELKPSKHLRSQLKRQSGIAVKVLARIWLLAHCPIIQHRKGTIGLGLGLKKDEKTELAVILQHLGYPLP